MKGLILAATILASSPALAQHGGHAMSRPQRPAATPAPPRATPPSTRPAPAPARRPAPRPQSRSAPPAAPSSADPHAGHDMPAPARPQTPVVDGDAMPMDHAMPAQGEMKTSSEQGHDGHDMGMPATDDSMSDPHAGHDMQGEEPMAMPPASGPPPAALSGPEHAADTIFGAEALEESREALRVEQGGFTTHGFFIDRLEAQIREGEDAYVWDINAWYGGDIDKFWVKSEGEGIFDAELEEAEIQALWSRAIGPYFDFQAGVRYDIRPEPDRTHIVAGVMGLAPYFFEIDAAAFLSDEGDLTARVEAEYDQRITQRLILQPRIEASFAAQDIPEIDIGAGLSSIEAGLRLRYEFVPEFAPYIGVEWQQLIGQTADYARAAGEDPGKAVFIAGVRVWF